MSLLWIFISLVLLYWLAISFLAIKINLRTFEKLKSYEPLHNEKPQWEGIIRNDFGNWKKKSIIIGSFTILPYRFFALANFLVGALLFALVIGWLSDGAIKERIVKMCWWYFNHYGRLMNNIAIKIEDNCPTALDRKINTPIVISNHSNWFDTFYLTLKYSPVSYVAKYEVQFWPFIGPCSKAMGCIFVKRTNEDDRNSAKNLIKKRIDDFTNGITSASPLIIYPEGTTSNNRVIMNFKSGAFDNLSPITMFSLKYECENFLMGEDELEQIEHIFLMLSQKNKLVSHKQEMRPLDGENAEQYMERCRDQMAKTLNFPKVNLGYRDRLDIENYRKTALKRK